MRECKILKLAKYAGLTAIVTGTAINLSLGAITRGDKIYRDGEKSKPITDKKNFGAGVKEVVQTLIGKNHGGRIVTETTILFHHNPDHNSFRRTSQNLGKGSTTILTDGSRVTGS